MNFSLFYFYLFTLSSPGSGVAELPPFSFQTLDPRLNGLTVTPTISNSPEPFSTTTVNPIIEPYLREGFIGQTGFYPPPENLSDPSLIRTATLGLVSGETHPSKYVGPGFEYAEPGPFRANFGPHGAHEPRPGYAGTDGFPLAGLSPDYIFPSINLPGPVYSNIPKIPIDPGYVPSTRTPMDIPWVPFTPATPIAIGPDYIGPSGNPLSSGYSKVSIEPSYFRPSEIPYTPAMPILPPSVLLKNNSQVVSFRLLPNSISNIGGPANGAYPVGGISGYGPGAFGTRMGGIGGRAGEVVALPARRVYIYKKIQRPVRIHHSVSYERLPGAREVNRWVEGGSGGEYAGTGGSVTSGAYTPGPSISPPTSYQGSPLVPNEPGSYQGGPLVPNEPGSYQGSPLVPNEPGSSQGGPIVPNGPYSYPGGPFVFNGPGSYQGGPVVFNGPGSYQGGPLVPNGPDSYQAGPLVPNGSNSYRGGPFVPNGPGSYQGGPLVPNGPDSYQGGPLLPNRPGSYQGQGGPVVFNGPGSYQGGPLVPNGPESYQGGPFIPNGPDSYQGGPLVPNEPDSYQGGPVVFNGPGK